MTDLEGRPNPRELRNQWNGSYGHPRLLDLRRIYIEVDKFGEELVKHPEKSLPSLLVTINGLFSKLEALIGHFHTVCQSDSSVDGSYSFPLMFEKFPKVNQEGSQWTNCEIRDAINLIYENLHKLDSYLNVITSGDFLVYMGLNTKNEIVHTLAFLAGVMFWSQGEFHGEVMHTLKFVAIGRKNLGLRAQNLHLKIVASMESEKEFQELNRNLYPDIEPYSSGFLKVSGIHTIYWEQSGNPNGHPVVFLHGGPGGGTSPSNRKFFDPDFFRIILFDQRGAGKSTPHACLEENTTWDLVEDIEKLRKHLEIPEWQVFGGSWGSTLALAYSQSHPDKVTGIILRGIFLMRKKELDWFYEGGAAAIYPDVILLKAKKVQTEFWFRHHATSAWTGIFLAWESFRDLIPENERESFIDAYWKRLNSVDLETQKSSTYFLSGEQPTQVHASYTRERFMQITYTEFGEGFALPAPAARVWTKWELTTAHLLPNEDNIKKGDDDKFSLAFARIENHYFVNKGFFASDSFLLDNVEKIRHINTVIVQGRYDMCCPMMSAWDLHKAWPEAELKVVPNAGHSANEPGIAAELVAANEKLKNIIKRIG
ncbi:unnamed protein product [Camellia sinensis]